MIVEDEDDIQEESQTKMVSFEPNRADDDIEECTDTDEKVVEEFTVTSSLLLGSVTLGISMFDVGSTEFGVIGARDSSELSGRPRRFGTWSSFGRRGTRIR